MRRKIIGGICALGLTLGGSAVLANPAQAAPDVSQFCKAFGDFGSTHGACVSYLQTGNLTAFIADICREDFVQQFFGATNHGQCVKIIKALV